MIQQKHLCTVELKGYNCHSKEKDQKENENKNIECKFDSKRSITTCTIGKRV